MLGLGFELYTGLTDAVKDGVGGGVVPVLGRGLDVLPQPRAHVRQPKPCDIDVDILRPRDKGRDVACGLIMYTECGINFL